MSARTLTEAIAERRRLSEAQPETLIPRETVTLMLTVLSALEAFDDAVQDGEHSIPRVVRDELYDELLHARNRLAKHWGAEDMR